MKTWQVYFKKEEFDTDIDVIKLALPQLANVNPVELYRAWKDFSDYYCASWLIINPETCKNFIIWLEL